MINRIPDYLKLFVANEQDNETEKQFSIPHFARFCAVFPKVTGLGLEVSEIRSDSQLSFPWAPERQTSYRVAVSSNAQDNAGSLSDIRDFEDSLAAMLNSFSGTLEQLQYREAELAACVPVVSVEDDGAHLAERLEYLLRTTSELTDSSASALYMLDEATTCLKLRSSYGITPEAFIHPARPLEDAAADVEALAGHAVVIGDNESREFWEAPHPCQSAMCVPVSTATTILGTLWIYRDDASEFTVHDQNLAEVTAGRIASDLERAVLTQEVRLLREVASANTAMSAEQQVPDIQWVDRHIGQHAPAIPGWDLADGSTDPRGSIDFSHWYESESNRLHMTIGASRGDTPDKSSIFFQAALSAHASHDPDIKQLVSNTNSTLWRSTSDGEKGALFHAILDPSCGRVEYTAIGDVQAYILRPHAWEPLLADSQFLGADEDYRATVHRQILMPGDIIFATSLAVGVAQANAVAEKLLRNIHLSAQELNDLALRELSQFVIGNDSLTALVAKRAESY